MGNKYRDQPLPAGSTFRQSLKAAAGVSAVSWSADGKFITAAVGPQLVVWDVSSGRGVLTIPKLGASRIAITVDGDAIACLRSDRRLHIYHVKTGRLQNVLQPTAYEITDPFESFRLQTNTVLEHERYLDVAVSSDDIQTENHQARMIGTELDDKARRWVQFYPHSKRWGVRPHTDMAWSPDKSCFAFAYRSGIDVWWQSRTDLSRNLQGHTRTVNTVSWSPDSKLLASGSSDSTVRLWDPDSGDSRVLIGHSEAVRAVQWSPDGSRLATAGDDRTVRMWDVNSSAQLSRLEGHVDTIHSLAFSRDGRVLASSGGGVIHLWDVATGASLGELELEKAHGACLLVSAPTGFLVACARDRKIVILQIDPGTVPMVVSSESVHYANAKVVLVGDSGVGKSGLGLVLAGEQFVPTESSHGRRVWTLSKSEVSISPGRSELRETFLWDLAGQPGYRLIHQLHLGEVATAIIVFDARSETDPFAGVRHWDRALRQAKRVNSSTIPLRKLLVAARVDREGVSVSRTRIDNLMKELKIDGYFETSARQGWSIHELSQAIQRSIPWADLTVVSSNALLKSIKEFLLGEKTAGRVLATFDTLYQAFLWAVKADEHEAGFETCIKLLEAQGLLRRLSFGKFILLQPELLDAYASALVNAAKDEPDGLGCISEDVALAGHFRMPQDERLLDSELERVLLLATVEDLLRHEIALREASPEGVRMVFPSQFTIDWPDAPDPQGKSVIYEFEGPVMSVYTTLAVRLAYSGLFAKKQMWKNAAVYAASPRGECGLWIREVREGAAELALFFDADASDETRLHFEMYVQAHLQRRALPDSIRRRYIVFCQSCRTAVAEEQIRRRKERGFNRMSCNVCDRNISLLEPAERLLQPSVVSAIDQVIEARRDAEAAVTVLQGKISTQDFDVFLAHNSKDKPAVHRLAKALRDRGLYPWLDSEQIPPGRWFQTAIQEVIPTVSSAAIIIGPDGVGKWQAVEIKSFVSQCVDAGKTVIPVLLPGVDNLPKDLLFLRELNWVNFVTIEDPEALDRLQWGITGNRP